MQLTAIEKGTLAAALAVVLMLIAYSIALADDIACPQGTPCKIVTVTPQEEAALTAPNGILDMATWASRPLGDFANQWREKLRAAPAGKPYTTPKKE